MCTTYGEVNVGVNDNLYVLLFCVVHRHAVKSKVNIILCVEQS